ncbi:hypothetical protein D3C87_37850 [compost metagenome]
MRALFFLLFASHSLFAAQPEWMPDYSVSYLKSTVPKETRLRFVCSFDSDYNPHRNLRYGIDGSDEKIKLDQNNVYEFISSPGVHVFQFLYDLQFKEITTDSIEVKAGQITVISLHFKSQYEPLPKVKKPIIYFYPESDLEVSVQLKTSGELTFSYPNYASGWNGIAHPDGSIHVNGKHYPYLFWESEQRFNESDQEQSGFILNKTNVVESLENYLSDLGFNDKEQTDFITFWGPQLQQHEQVYIRFILHEECDQFAVLEIEPKPDHLNRVYMVWSPVKSAKTPVLKQAVLKKMDRSGFDVLEWGGIEVPEMNL